MKTFKTLINHKYFIVYFMLFIATPKNLLGIALKNITSFPIINTQQISVFGNPSYINKSTVITESGAYALNNTLTFNPSEPGSACIVIDADNVIFDLNRNAIIQTTQQEQSSGIFIKPGRKNIVIRNGSIRKMSAYGIYISDGADMITINTINIDNVGLAGIKADGLKGRVGISNITCSNVAIQNIVNAQDASIYGIILKYTTIANLEKCMSNNLLSNAGNCNGFKIKKCSSIRFDSCIANKISGDGLFTIGFNIINSKGAMTLECLSTNNSSLNTDPSSLVLGFNSERSNNQFYSQCTAGGNSNEYSICGFRLIDVTTCQLIQCQALTNNSTSLDATGYLINGGTDIECNMCESHDNVGINFGYGFHAINTSNNIITKAKSHFNQGTNKISYGIYLEKVSNSTITNNIILGNGTNREGYGIFDDTNAETNTILSNYAQKNQKNYIPADPIIPIFAGPLSATPSPFENISI